MSTVTSQTPKVVAETVVNQTRLPVDLPPSAPALAAARPGTPSQTRRTRSHSDDHDSDSDPAGRPGRQLLHAPMRSAPGRGPLKHKNPAKFEIDINKSFVMPNRCRQIQTLFWWCKLFYLELVYDVFQQKYNFCIWMQNAGWHCHDKFYCPNTLYIDC